MTDTQFLAIGFVLCCSGLIAQVWLLSRRVKRLERWSDGGKIPSRQGVRRRNRDLDAPYAWH